MRRGLPWIILSLFLGTLGLCFASNDEGYSLPETAPADMTEASWIRLREVYSLLAESDAGRKLLARAGTQLERVRWGEVSRTDAILTRKFDTATGAEKRIREVTVILKSDQSVEESVLDLAHELIHALAGPQWDPYDPKLSIIGYIQAVIDGVGGEVEALTSECTVSLELAKNRQWNPGRCARYDTGNGEVDSELLRKDFYTVGRWKVPLVALLKHEGVGLSALPLLNGGKPVFYSSTGQAPYPAALAREYQELTQVACGNSLRRLSTLSSTASTEGLRAKEMTTDFLQHRCFKTASLNTKQ